MFRRRQFPRDVEISDRYYDASNSCIYGSLTSNCIYGGYWVYLLIEGVLNSLWLYNDISFMERSYAWNNSYPINDTMTLVLENNGGDWLLSKVTSGSPYQVLVMIADIFLIICTLGIILLIICQTVMYRGITYIFIFGNSILLILTISLRNAYDANTLNNSEFYSSIGILIVQVILGLADLPLCWFSMGYPRLYHILNSKAFEENQPDSTDQSRRLHLGNDDDPIGRTESPEEVDEAIVAVADLVTEESTSTSTPTTNKTTTATIEQQRPEEESDVDVVAQVHNDAVPQTQTQSDLESQVSVT